MPNASVPAASEAVPADMIDELLALGIRLGAAIREEENLQSRSGAARRAKKLSAETYLDHAAEHVSDEVYALRDMIASVKATSLAGAAVQLAEALARVDMVWDQFPQEAETYRIKQDVRVINRLLYSVLDLVDGLAERKLAEIVTPDFGSPYLNPWVPVEARCGELKTGGEV